MILNIFNQKRQAVFKKNLQVHSTRREWGSNDDIFTFDSNSTSITSRITFHKFV